MPTITGPFHVELTPLAPSDDMAGLPFGRRALAKRFEGPLTGTSRGEMISWMTPVKGSAGYTALELVRATLEGREGSFVLQHSSFLRRGEPEQSIRVVPDSGSGGLAGIRGSMRIDIGPGGAHAYEFTYDWDPVPA